MNRPKTAPYTSWMSPLKTRFAYPSSGKRSTIIINLQRTVRKPVISDDCPALTNMCWLFRAYGPERAATLCS